MASRQQARRAAHITTIASVLGNIVLGISKLAGGIAFNSHALIADAIHSAADLATDFIAWIAVIIGRNEADESHPYGHGKFETFGTFALSVVLAATGAGIIINDAQNLITGDIQPVGFMAALVAIGVIVVKEFLFWYCLKQGRAVDSQPIIANAWHHRADSLSSLVVVVGVGLGAFGLARFDPLAAMVVGGILVHMGYKLGHEAFNELVDASIDPAKLSAMGNVLKNTEGVVSAHDLRARRLGSQFLVDVHVEVSPYISVSEGHRIAELTEYNLKNQVKGIGDVVVHIDPAKHDHSATPAPLSRQDREKEVRALVKKVDKQARVEEVTLHLIDDTCYGEVMLSHPTSGVLTDKKKDLEKALLKPSGPFDKVRLTKLID